MFLFIVCHLGNIFDLVTLLFFYYEYLSIYISICSSFCLSVCQFICLSFYLSGSVLCIKNIYVHVSLFNFNNLFLDKGCGHKLTHTNKKEISINPFPVCCSCQSIFQSIIYLFVYLSVCLFIYLSVYLSI